MLNDIPPKRLLIYTMLLGLLPLLLAGFLFLNELNGVKEISDAVSQMKETAFQRLKKQSINTTVRNHYRDADHFYIDKNLETMSFLAPEIDSLQKIASNKNFPEDENIKKRLEQLNGPGNKLQFVEGVVLSNPVFQETTETLVHPVEINISDLKNVLAKIEGVPVDAFQPGLNRPQLIITDFKLDKKSVSDKNEVFVLNLKLLKREFL